jgi:hypothetical protein
MIRKEAHNSKIIILVKNKKTHGLGNRGIKNDQTNVSQPEKAVE